MKLIDWIINKYFIKHIDRFVQKKVAEEMNEFHAYFKDYIKKLNVITASDTPAYKRNTGFMVVVCKVKNNDYIKILPIEGCKGVNEWREMCRELSYRYGAKHLYFDSVSHGRFEKEILRQEGLLEGII
jgi:hypothetical protein